MFPYEPRPGQTAMAEAIAANRQAGGHLVIEAGTGLGKTIVALSASLGERTVMATRTNAQQDQVLKERQAIGAASDALVVPLMGRSQYCPLLAEEKAFDGASSEELGRLCRRAKAKARVAHETGTNQQGSCPYYERLLADGPGPVEALIREADSARDLGAKVASAGACPYEAIKEILPNADIVVLPFIYLIDERLRAGLTSWLGTGLDGVHLLIDEAHNLPTAARDHHSPGLGIETLKRAQKECQELDDPTLAGSTLTSSLLDALTRTIYDLVDECAAGRDDGLVPPDALQDHLHRRLRLPTPALRRAATEVEHLGQIIRQTREEAGRLPRSYLGAVGTFLAFWLDGQELPYVHTVQADPPRLEAVLMDPAAVLAWLQEAASTTQMSGTLAPLSGHVESCGLPARTTTLTIPSPYEAGHLRIIGVHGVHRRFQAHQEDPEAGARLQQAARDVIGNLPGRTAIWFPSHDMLNDYVEEGFLHGLRRDVFREERGSSHAGLLRLLERFRAQPDALLLGVLGGRLAEGVDYPGDTLENCILMGIPYPRPSARSDALIHHADARHGDGWRREVHGPVARVMRQAIGRLIRGPEDRGTAVILDERIVRFREHIPTLQMVDDATQVTPLNPPWEDPRQGGFESAATHQNAYLSGRSQR